MTVSETHNKPSSLSLTPPESKPYFEWKSVPNEETGRHEIKSVELSDGSQIDSQKFKQTLKRTVGTSDQKLGPIILNKISHGLAEERADQRLNDASALLPALQPQDETEAMLLGQYLALHDSAMKCLRLANLPDQGFYHEEKLFLLANKLLNTANQTMQTVLKYRSKGQQTVQVIHVHNEGQAIVAQNLSHSTPKGGKRNKNSN